MYIQITDEIPEDNNVVEINREVLMHVDHIVVGDTTIVITDDEEADEEEEDTEDDEEDSDVCVGPALKEFRTGVGHTQDQVADLASVSLSTVSRIEAGESVRAQVEEKIDEYVRRYSGRSGGHWTSFKSV